MLKLAKIKIIFYHFVKIRTGLTDNQIKSFECVEYDTFIDINRNR